MTVITWLQSDDCFLSSLPATTNTFLNTSSRVLYIFLCDFTHTFYSKYNKIGCRYFWSLPDNWKTAKYLDTLVRSQSSVLFLVGMWWLTGSYLLIWNLCRMTLSCFLCTAHNFHRKYCYQSFNKWYNRFSLRHLWCKRSENE